ncbi:hypothetical protein DPMN_085238 [Dreissena polymorpha]|uniref:Nuclear transcription factor Y subunit gamma n=2 Tax=Dreissena polymorpha TaxID=45954 RepID=A0A9D3YCA5_DREPO|nr:hypothetical protein DPMN_085238 [Dreissena polymorpha]
MKLDEDVKMISAEAPVLFSKACEIFISEISMRAWVHTEDNKRRTLQRNDIAMAISKFDQFDFLIDIVPREDIKPSKRQDEPRSGVLPEQIQYYLQMAAQQQQQAQQQSQQQQTTIVTQPSVQTSQIAQSMAQAISTPHLQLAGGQILQQPYQVVQQAQASIPSNQSQVITIQPPQMQQQQQQQVQQVQVQQPQVFQQVVNPNGQVENVPIQLTPEQLKMIQMQLQGSAAHSQQIIIQTTGGQPVSRSGLVQADNSHYSQNVFQDGQPVYLQDGDQGDG